MKFTPENIEKLRAEEKELIKTIKGSIFELQKNIDNNNFADENKKQSAITLKNELEIYVKELEENPW